MNTPVFDRYTSTHMLAGEDEAALTRWSACFFRKFILPHLPINKKADILDCGCGYGRYLKVLHDSGYTNACGVDISPEQVAYARERLGLANTHLGSGSEFLGNHPASYDAILLMDILEHLSVDDSIRVVSAAHKGLRPGGILVVVAPNALCPMNVYRYSDITHERAYTVRSLGQTLRLGGFEKMRFLPLPPVAHNLASGVRRAIWHCLINPSLHVFVRLCHGPNFGGIYTGNLLAVVHRTENSKSEC